MQPSPTDVLRELSTSECRERLRSAQLGRLAITFKALPVVIPVKISTDGTVIGISSLYGDAVPLPAGSIVALEAGTLGEGQAGEWSVEVRGVLSPNPSIDRADGSGTTGSDFLVSSEMLAGWARR